MPKRLPREQLEELCEETKLTPKEVRALYSRFRRLAPNGFLNKEQFRQTMGVLGLTDDTFLPDRMFKVFDADQDEKLSFQEFATSLAVMIRGTEDEKLKLSFDMTAGQRGASGIKLEDFHRLIQACNTMMSSMVAPSRNVTTKEDVERLFHDLSSDEGCIGRDGDASDGEVITLEAYKAAAQNDELFLQCLGLRGSGGVPGPNAPRKSVSGVVCAKSRARASTATRELGAGILTTATVPSSSSSPSLAPTLAPTGPQPPAGSHVVTQVQIEELRERVARLNVLLQERARPSSPSRRSGSPLPESDTVDEEERWWTPLPARRPNHGARGSVQVDQVRAELDRLISWCASAESGPHAQPQLCFATTEQSLTRGVRYDAGARTPTRREISRDSSSCEERVVKQNVHRLANLANGPGGRSVPTLRGDRSCTPPEDPDIKGTLSRRGSMKVDASSRRVRRRHRLLGPKKGLAVHFGHENWNMVLSMMIGIRMAVGRSRMEQGRELQPVDFCMKEKFSILPRMANIFDSEVSKRVSITRFIDYSPLVFQRIRASFGIQHDDYLRSLGPEQLLGNMVLGNLSSLAELSSEGKSGAFFYYTADGNYMLKTVAPKEFVLLRRMLKSYYDHIFNNHGTLLVRFLGLHCLSVRKTRRGPFFIGKSIKKLYFVVMANMFNTPFEINRRYDLKGSWVGRQTPPDKYDSSVALKDVDFQHANECIRVGEERRAHLLKQLELDAHFLASQNIIDYSLLLGIHEIGKGGSAPSSAEDLELNLKPDPLADTCSVEQLGRAHTEPPGQVVGLAATDPLPGSPASAGTAPEVPVVSWPHLHESLMAKAPPLHRRDSGGILSQDKKCLYFVGVIDILTPYDTLKVVEHSLKGLRYDRQGVSCCPPTMYAERFIKFMKGAIG